ncbi:sporulation inhibitor of replication protein SirA [Siminovitchia sp. FSL H7-0308]|uniref:Sporulation inhibitor of replication protein SirA n=1 Tax=Siminovitchia thermophila TaxID=1245522 RepID=A0ABS2RAE9_9BACI|nr:sporulation inhibitor of replication protein SirA [Siminovitchia thermophila]MBM7716631.1 hypothetical protein [Siminovitchia thermophila]ONK24335.1 hypothetical protein BLX87_05740 [Bacillus sp. VT-16-64]
MRKYSIYLIKDEFADYFYGRESKFYKLFTAQDANIDKQRKIIKQQIDYITRPLPFLELHKLLSESIQNRKIMIKGKVYCTGNPKGRNGAELAIEENLLCLKAWGGFESESVFFEVLRKYEGHFFAVDRENERYGWVKPVKERKYI